MKENISENLKKALLQFNLTEKEIGTYLVLLEQGALSVQDISKSTGINRVTTYAAIEELKQKGLASESRKGKRKLFVAENPESLENIFGLEVSIVTNAGEDEPARELLRSFGFPFKK